MFNKLIYCCLYKWIFTTDIAREEGAWDVVQIQNTQIYSYSKNAIRIANIHAHELLSRAYRTYCTV